MEEKIIEMNLKFIYSALLLFVVLNPGVFIQLVLGFVVGYVLKNNETSLKMKMVNGETEEDGSNTSLKRDNKSDVHEHLKHLGIGLKVEDEDMQYLQDIWKSLKNMKNTDSEVSN